MEKGDVRKMLVGEKAGNFNGGKEGRGGMEILTFEFLSSSKQRYTDGGAHEKAVFNKIIACRV